MSDRYTYRKRATPLSNASQAQRGQSATPSKVAMESAGSRRYRSTSAAGTPRPQAQSSPPFPRSAETLPVHFVTPPGGAGVCAFKVWQCRRLKRPPAAARHIRACHGEKAAWRQRLSFRSAHTPAVCRCKFIRQRAEPCSAASRLQEAAPP